MQRTPIPFAIALFALMSATPTGAAVTVTPDSVGASVPAGTTWTDTLTIRNTGAEAIAWTLSGTLDRVLDPPVPGGPPPGTLTGVDMLWDYSDGGSYDNTFRAQIKALGASSLLRYSRPTASVLSGREVMLVSSGRSGSWNTESYEAVRDWTLAGGTLILSSDGPLHSKYDEILEILGAGLTIEPSSGAAGTTTDIRRHFLTQGVESLELTPQLRLSATADGWFPFARALNGDAVAAIRELGDGHVIVFLDGLFRSESLGIPDHNEVALRMMRWPVRPQWLFAEPVSGWLVPGDSAHVVVTLDAIGVGEGVSSGALLVATSDDPPTEALVPVDLDATDTERIAVVPNGLAYGVVGVGEERNLFAHAINEGLGPVTLDGATVGGGAFLVDAALGDIAPGTGLGIRVRFTPPAPGAYADTLVVASNDAVHPEIRVPLAGTAEEPPEYWTDATPIDVTVDADEVVQRSFLVGNRGATTLTWEAIPAATRETPTGVPRDLEGRGLDLIHLGEHERDATLDALRDRGLIARTGGYIAIASREDVIWLTDSRGITDPADIDTLAAWVGRGSSVLVEGVVPGANDVLAALGSGITIVPEAGADPGNTDEVFPHPVTFGVDSLRFDGERATLDVPPPAVVLATDELGRPVVAVESASGGEVLVVARRVFRDDVVAYADNTRFAQQCVEWLAGPTWLGVDPRRVHVDPGDSVTVTVTLDAAGRIGEIVEGALLLRHDDPFAPPDSLPVALDVRGVPGIDVEPVSLDFGLAAIGDTITDTLEVHNPGSGVLTVADIRADLPVFMAMPTTFPVEPGGTVPVVVTFTPDVPALFNGALTVVSDAVSRPELVLRVSGSSLHPLVSAESDVQPAAARVGESLTSTVTVSNSGGSPLHWELEVESQRPTRARRHWTLPVRDDDGEAARSPGREALPDGEGGPPPELSADLYDLTGVRVLADRRHWDYWGNPYSILRDDLVARGAEVVVSTDSLTVELLDDFDVMWVVSFGGWMPVEARAVADWVQGGGDLVLESIGERAPVNMLLSFLTPGLRVKPGGHRSATDLEPHAITAAVGSLTLAYGAQFLRDEPVASEVLARSEGDPVALVRSVGAGRLIACAGRISHQSALLDNRLFLNQAFDWLAGQWMWADRTDGVLARGEEATVHVTRDARRLDPGEYAATVRLLHDDPTQPAFAWDATWTALAQPIVEIEPAALSFGTLFVGDESAQSIHVTNPGAVAVHVASVEADDAAFTVEPGPFTVPPGGTHDLVVTFGPGEPGERDATLRIVHDAPASPFVAALSGRGLAPPAVSLDPAELSVTTPPGGQATGTLTLCNTGADGDDGGLLHFRVRSAHAPPPGRLLADRGLYKRADEPPHVALRGTGGPDERGYSWADSDDPYGPAYAWIDLGDVGTALPFAADDQVSDPVSIGFAFPFHDDVFEEVTISSNGWLSLVPETASFPENVPLPSLDAPLGVIAPFWDDLQFGRILHHADSSRFVVEWELTSRYGASAGGPYTFEVILHADGRIVMQYLRLRGRTDRNVAEVH
ncbi:choice-of-anchor D domain-containing protein [bacterium]|nr:choice-of-anchor D domain-containing protein [bacterium]